jgi:hypothetical protein
MGITSRPYISKFHWPELTKSVSLELSAAGFLVLWLAYPLGYVSTSHCICGLFCFFLFFFKKRKEKKKQAVDYIYVTL